jgi:hypothetical protein
MKFDTEVFAMKEVTRRLFRLLNPDFFENEMPFEKLCFGVCFCIDDFGLGSYKIIV